MGKIRLKDLATKMGVPEQDLAFKFQSIGIRVEGEDAMIDTDAIQAVLKGKNLPQAPARDVIMRDKEAQQTAPPTPRRAPPPQRRPAPPPMRPNRRRTVVQKGDPKIKTIPGRRREKKATPEEVAAAAMVEQEAQTAGLAATEAEVAAESKEEATAVEPTIEVAAEVAADAPVKPEAEAAPAEEAVEEEEGPKQSRSERRKQRTDELAGRTEETITISEGIKVRDLAEKLGMLSKDLMKHMIGRGIMASVNHVLDPELAKSIAESLDHNVMLVSFEEEIQLQNEQDKVKTTGSQLRSPVVTVMGHVDHGKTSLLDAIRSSKLTDAEHGGITQHIAAYSVDVTEEQRVVFLDTPGHEAFTQLRARGARVTDIVILVVAADDGVMPQTIEAIQHAKAAGVPIIVAINKIDRPNANQDRVKKELADHELLVEDWGGDVSSVPISALKGEGIDDLLEIVMLTAEILELRCDPTLPAQGVVIEARKEQGRGTLATVLVQNGTLSVGDAYVAGPAWGRVRYMTNDKGERVKQVGPATPVEVSGFNDLPGAGDALQVVEREKMARDIADMRRHEMHQQQLAPSAGRMSLENLFSQVEAGEVKELPIIVKADVQGSVEVLRETLRKLSTDKVKLNVIGAGAGAISTNDVLLASASNAIVVGFNVRPERNAADLARQEEVEIRAYTVIYELTDDIKLAMTGLLEPTYREVELGRAEIRETFKVPKIGTVAGCHVTEGQIKRNAGVRLLRDNVVVYEGTLASLRRFKDDVSEVRSGFDCGLGLERFQDIKPGDVVEAFTQEAVAATL